MVVLHEQNNSTAGNEEFPPPIPAVIDKSVSSQSKLALPPMPIFWKSQSGLMMEVCWLALPLLFPVSMMEEPSALSKVATALLRKRPRSKDLGFDSVFKNDLAPPPEQKNYRLNRHQRLSEWVLGSKPPQVFE